MHGKLGNLSQFLFPHGRRWMPSPFRFQKSNLKSGSFKLFWLPKVTSPFSTSCQLKKDSETKENRADDQLMDAVLADAEHAEFVQRVFRVRPMGHQVMVIQPRVKWGPKKRVDTTPDLQMQESVALVETLPAWKVVDRVIVPVKNYESKYLFGSGNVETLKERVRENSFISAVLINVNLLRAHQMRALKEEFRLPVYDRYSIVLQIFRDHAKTREAKLQVALAEIPYLRVKIGEAIGGTGRDRGGGGAPAIGGEGEKWIKVKMDQLEEREKTIKKSLVKLESHRKILKRKRSKMQIPTVAVVGYTNSGKTSLIKSLTRNDKLEPKDQLFATLDVTTHAGVLPSRQTALFVDTVGFVADIPTTLIDAFRATLGDAIDADIIVHVFDVSHPDILVQHEVVKTTLQSMVPESKLKNMISVANKMDLVDDPEPALQKIQQSGAFLVSCTQQKGLALLMDRIEKCLIDVTERQIMMLRVPSGGEESAWLYKMGAVKEVTADPDDAQYLLFEVILTPTLSSRFAHAFPHVKSQLLNSQEV